MSCYVCDMETISVIVKGFVQYGYIGHHAQYCADDFTKPAQGIFDIQALRQAIGQSLLNQNYKSVNCRYDEDNKPPKFQYVDVKINEGLVYGCMRCYEYQAHETDDYFTSDVHYSLNRLENVITERLLRQVGQEAPWGYVYNMFD